MDDALEDRVDALERAVTDDGNLSALTEAGEVTARLDTIETQIAEIERRVDELDGATQALRGYVGNIRSVNRDVEDRADAALSKVESLEDRLDDRESTECGRRESDRTHAEEGQGSSAVSADVADGWPRSDSEPRMQGAAQTDSTRDAHDRRCRECGRPRTTDGGVNSATASTSATSRTASNTDSHDPFGSTTERAESDDPLQPEPSATNGSSGPLERIRQLL
jgi:hypothetical protein